MKAYLALKRLMDLVISSLGLVMLAPLFGLVALLIQRDSPGPVIFKQQRVGREEKLFWVYKFRTMYASTPASVATSELKNAKACITPVGRILRKTSIDELPQLFNVLRGDMSLIGPRPLVPQEKDIHELRSEMGAYKVRPGITGWAQVNGRDCVDARTKATLDAYYASHISPWVEFKVIAYSILCVVTGRGIQEGGGAPEDTPEDVDREKRQSPPIAGG